MLRIEDGRSRIVSCLSILDAPSSILDLSPRRPLSVSSLQGATWVIDTTVAPVLPILGVSFPFTNISFSAQKPLDPAYPTSILTIGDHIRTRRLDLGLYQKDVARMMNVKEDTV